jgi:hypothetical protein
MDGAAKRFVYVLRSEADSARHYVGITSNPRERLDWHNGGPCGYTRAHRPWSVEVSIEKSKGKGSVADYVAAFEATEARITPTQREMLLVHHRVAFTTSAVRR